MDKDLVKLRSKTLQKVRKFFDDNNFLEVIPPVIVGATGACENVPTVFGIDYFDRKAFLAQTTQLFLEAYVYDGIDRVYSINKSFRAEPRLTPRHQTEFTLIEFEAANMGLKELIELESDFIQTIAGYGTPTPIHTMTYQAAISALRSAGLNIKFGDDLSSQAEQILTGKYGITIVTHYPAEIKFFNMKVTRPDDPADIIPPGEQTVECCDLLLPGVGETIGGSEREHHPVVMKNRLTTSPMLQQLIQRGGNAHDFDWYLSLIQSKVKQRAGAGIGFDRLIQWLSGKHSIKDCVEFPRDAETLIP